MVMKLSFFKSVFFTFSFVAIVSLSYAQNIARVNNRAIDAKEFMWVFQKNNVDKQRPSLNVVENYLQLYINFRLKVAEAKALGFDLDTNYRNEIAGYEKALKEQSKPSSVSSEYQYIMNEYRDGVLMFNLSEQKIWNKAQEDEAKLKAFFNTHRESYKDKEYAEVRGQVISDFQNQLEQEWIKELRQKYKVEIYPNELKKLTR